jgi:two-component system sensor histidine kinase KdpD
MLMKAASVPALQRRSWTGAPQRARAAPWVPYVASLASVAAITVLLHVADRLFDLEHVAFAYLVPIIVAATRWGVMPAVFSGVAGAAASAFFFYPPLYNLHVIKPAHVADLVLFLVVGVVTGQLANSVREHVRVARQREAEMKALYLFSRRLAVASGPDDIHSAIESHLSAITGCPIALFAPGVESSRPEALPQWSDLPDTIRGTLLDIFEGRSGSQRAPLIDEASGTGWLVRTLSQGRPSLGIVAIQLGHVAGADADAIGERVDAALAEAVATLERIDVAHALSEAKLRSQGETLRAALIGSVSHELRTPLASILGSASVLAAAPGIAQEPRLSSLVDIIRGETERLNNDIQNLLDASRISSTGVEARLAWAEPPDIVNAALARLRQRLADHRLDLLLATNLPLVRIDPVLIEQALHQIIDNAAKYSPPGGTITVSASAGPGSVEIAVTDQGAGLDDEERVRLFERFYRGPRHQAAVKGSGLGLWIARAFVLACGGQITAASAGAGRGTTITISLPAPATAEADTMENGDE